MHPFSMAGDNSASSFFPPDCSRKKRTIDKIPNYWIVQKDIFHLQGRLDTYNMCSKFIFYLLWFASFWTLISSVPAANFCENVNMDFNYTTVMKTWHVVYRTDSEHCGQVTYSNFNGAGFQINFDADSTKLSALINPNGKTNLNINGHLYQHAVVTNNSGSYVIVYLCPMNDRELSDLVWVLSLSPHFDTIDETLQQLVGGGKLCGSSPEPSTETSSGSTAGTTESETETTLEDTTTGGEEPTTNSETSPSETTAQVSSTVTSEITTEDSTATTVEGTSETDSSETTAEVTSDATPEITTEDTTVEVTSETSTSVTDTPKVPETTEQTTASTTETAPQETTQTIPPPSSDFPEGFTIPGSDKIFYFESQIRKHAQTEKPHI